MLTSNNDDGCCPKGSLPCAPKPNDPNNNKACNIETISIPPFEPMKVYRAGNRDLSRCNRIILIFSDVYGFDYGHHFAVSDSISQLIGQEKTSVILPDIFRGEPPMKPDSSILDKIAREQMLEKTKNKYNDSYCQSVINDVLIPWMKSEGADVERIGISCIGICYGAWVAAKCLARGCPCRCAVGIHPSLSFETMNGGSIEALISSIKDSPFLLMPAGNDPNELKPGGEVAISLAKARSVAEIEVSVPFENMIHGFLTRGDVNDPDVNKAQTKARELTARFILEHHKLP